MCIYAWLHCSRWLAGWPDDTTNYAGTFAPWSVPSGSCWPTSHGLKVQAWPCHASISSLPLRFASSAMPLVGASLSRTCEAEATSTSLLF